MTNDRLELRLPALLAEIGATDASGLLDDILASTATTRQRPRQLARVVIDDPWILSPKLSPAVRIVLVGLLLLVLAAAAVIVGSELLRQTPRPPFASENGAFVSLDPIPDRMDVVSADLLPDGRVLLMGPQWDSVGTTGQSWTGWALKIWDPATNKFTTYPRPIRAPQPPDTVPSSKPIDRVVALDDGRVLVIDGWDGPLKPTTWADIFDPHIGAFSPAAPLTAPRLSTASVQLADGRVLLSGGEPPEKDPLPFNTVDGEPALATSEIFDPTTNRFEPGPTMTAGRLGHAMTLLADGRVLVVGGSDGNEETAHALRSAEIFDPSSGTFSATGSMAKFRGYFEVPPVRLADGRVLLIGGESYDRVRDTIWDAAAQVLKSGTISTEVYDPAAGTFTAGPELPHQVSTATLLADGKVLLTGTWWESHQKAPAVASFQRDEHRYAWAGVLDPSTWAVREIPAVSGATTEPGAPTPHSVRLGDGRVLVVEGWDANDHVSPEGVVGMFQGRSQR